MRGLPITLPISLPIPLPIRKPPRRRHSRMRLGPDEPAPECKRALRGLDCRQASRLGSSAGRMPQKAASGRVRRPGRAGAQPGRGQACRGAPGPGLLAGPPDCPAAARERRCPWAK